MAKYSEALHPDWAWSLASQGKIDKEIAKEMGISVSTLNKWKKDHPEFMEALTSGKDPADARVERSLFARAIGYTYKERRIINTIDKTGKPVPSKIEVIEKHVPPDTTAQIFWLKNRQPLRYRDKQDVDISTQKDIVFNIVGAKGAVNSGHSGE